MRYTANPKINANAPPMPLKKNPVPNADIRNETNIGPALKPNPATNTKLPLAATICCGSRRSLAYAMHNEYSGIAMPPSSTTAAKNHALPAGNSTATTVSKTPAPAIAAMTTRRSLRSDHWPSGH